MAKTLKQLSNGLRIKKLKYRGKPFFLFDGNSNILINEDLNGNGFDSMEEAEKIGNTLVKTKSQKYPWVNWSAQ